MLFLATFFHGKDYVLYCQKMGWATFWAIFSQTHLVTLLVSAMPGKQKKSDIGRYTLSRKKEMYHRKNVKTITGKEDRDIHIITKTDTKTDKFDFTTTYVHTYYFITAFW
jgi:hypothetical protein